MTTFHELLGTDDRCSIVEIKKRYRQLSIKLHPDKGGSQALMQMLSMAYQQVSKGNGNKKCSDIILINEQSSGRQRQQLADLKKQIVVITQEKVQLQVLFDSYQRKAEQVLCDEKSKQQTLVLLQATNHSLNEQLVLLRRQVEVGSTNVSLPVTKDKKQYIVMICVVLIIITLVSWFIWHYQTQHQQSQPVTVTAVPIAAQVTNVKVIQPTTIENVDVINHVDKIMMMDTVGSWQQRYYEGTRQPYIAVRSLNGSYIVKDCQGTFSYYSNRSHNTTHVPVNLIFSANDRQFAVYRIPYGNGSSDQQWLDSYSVSINNNIFSNHGYKSSALALAAVCNNTVPF